MIRWFAMAAALTLALPAAAQDCGDAVRSLSARYGITVEPAADAAATAPSAPATSESLGVAVMDRLRQADSVNRPAAGGSTDGTASADGTTGTRSGDQARRIQAEALLNEAWRAAKEGRVTDCEAKLNAARPLLDMPAATPPADGGG